MLETSLLFLANTFAEINDDKTSKKIAMTAPVQQQQSGASWTISFVMPSEYTLSTIPKPNREEIKLTLIASKEFIVIRFSGTNSDELTTKYQTELLGYIAKRKIKIVGEPKYAFYNPPWTLPFLRRNEIAVGYTRNKAKEF